MCDKEAFERGLFSGLTYVSPEIVSQVEIEVNRLSRNPDKLREQYFANCAVNPELPNAEYVIDDQPILADPEVGVFLESERSLLNSKIMSVSTRAVGANGWNRLYSVGARLSSTVTHEFVANALFLRTAIFRAQVSKLGIADAMTRKANQALRNDIEDPKGGSAAIEGFSTIYREVNPELFRAVGQRATCSGLSVMEVLYETMELEKSEMNPRALMRDRKIASNVFLASYNQVAYGLLRFADEA